MSSREKSHLHVDEELREKQPFAGHSSTGRNGHLQHRDPKPPPSIGRSGFYPGVKLTKSGCVRTSPPSRGRPDNPIADAYLDDDDDMIVMMPFGLSYELHRLAQKVGLEVKAEWICTQPEPLVHP